VKLRVFFFFSAAGIYLFLILPCLVFPGFAKRRRSAAATPHSSAQYSSLSLARLSFRLCRRTVSSHSTPNLLLPPSDSPRAIFRPPSPGVFFLTLKISGDTVFCTFLWIISGPRGCASPAFAQRDPWDFFPLPRIKWPSCTPQFTPVYEEGTFLSCFWSPSLSLPDASGFQLFFFNLYKAGHPGVVCNLGQMGGNRIR